MILSLRRMSSVMDMDHGHVIFLRPAVHSHAFTLSWHCRFQKRMLNQPANENHEYDNLEICNNYKGVFNAHFLIVLKFTWPVMPVIRATFWDFLASLSPWAAMLVDTTWHPTEPSDWFKPGITSRKQKCKQTPRGNETCLNMSGIMSHVSKVESPWYRNPSTSFKTNPREHVQDMSMTGH